MKLILQKFSFRITRFYILIPILVISILLTGGCNKDKDEPENDKEFYQELYGNYASEDGEFTITIGDTCFMVNGMNYFYCIEDHTLNTGDETMFQTDNGVMHSFAIEGDGSITYEFDIPSFRPFNNGKKGFRKGAVKLIVETAVKKLVKYGVSSAKCRDTKGLDIGNNRLYVLTKLSNSHYDAVSIKLRSDGTLPLDPDDDDIINADSTIFAADAIGSEGSDIVFQENNGTGSNDGDFIHIIKKSLDEVRSYYSANIDQGATNGVTTNLATGVGINPRQGEAANDYLYMNSNDRMVYIGKFFPNQNKDKIDKVKIKGEDKDCDELHGLCIDPNTKGLLFVSCSDKDDKYWIESYTIDPTSNKGAKNLTYNHSTEKTLVRNYQQLICDGSIVYAVSTMNGHTLDAFTLDLEPIEMENHYAMQDVLDELDLVYFKSSDLALTQNTLYVSNGDEDNSDDRKIIAIDLVDYAERAKLTENLSEQRSVKLIRQ